MPLRERLNAVFISLAIMLMVTVLFVAALPVQAVSRSEMRSDLLPQPGTHVNVSHTNRVNSNDEHSWMLPAKTSGLLSTLASQDTSIQCGDSELLAWSICLQGSIWWQPITGTAVALTAIPITVSKGMSEVTGLSAVYSNQITPTYQIDISPLDPTFLEPVTLTANISGTLITQQIIVYPDFSSQSQQYDLLVSALSSFNDHWIWGTVVDFGAGGPVTGATVTVAHGGQQITVTTIQSLDAALPVYRFSQTDLAMIGVTTGDVVTLTAQYGDDKDLRHLTLGDNPIQLNFVTGWKCNDFDPLPDENNGSFPEDDNPLGGPDIACLWGYGRFDGQPIPNMQIQLHVNGMIYAGSTRVYPGETLPRYGIGIWGAHLIDGTTITGTGIYSGYTASEAITITLNEQFSQRFDLNLAEATLLNTFNNGDDINAVAWDGRYIWAGTTGGMVRWDPTDGQYQLFTTVNGLVSNHINALISDDNGTLWVGTADGVSRYNPSAIPPWETLTIANDQPYKEVQTLALAPDGSLWLGTLGHGVSHYIPGGTPEWETFTTNEGLTHNSVEAVTVADDGTLWFGTRGGLSHYIPGGNPEWETFTTLNGLPHNVVRAVVTDENGTLWVGTNDGLAHYMPDASPAWESFTTANGLTSNTVQAIVVAADQSLWFGLNGGVNHYTPGISQWESFTTADGLIGNNVNALTTGADGSLWFGTSKRGLSHYSSDSSPAWETFTTDSALANSFIQTLATDHDGSLWLGMKTGGVAHYTPGGNPEWAYFTSADGLIHNSVHAVFVTTDGTVWLGTNGGVSHYIPNGDPKWESFTTADGLSHNAVNAIASAEDGSLWFGTSNGVTHYTPGGSPEWETFTTSEGLAHNMIMSVAVAADGSLWFGTLSGGVSHYTPGSSPEWETFTTADGLGGDAVLAVLVSEDNTVWFGTRGGGLSHYTAGGNPAWETFTTADGLAHNTVRAITTALDGSYWVGTNEGISHYYPEMASVWETYTTADGLTANEIWAVTIGLDGTLWVGTKSGISQLAVPQSQSDLSVNMVGAATALASGTFSYTLQVTNYGEIAALNNVLTLTLPTSTTFMSATLPPTSITPLVWDLNTIAPGDGVTITVVVVLGQWTMDTYYTAVADVFTSVPESFMNNNSAQLNIRLVDPDHADIGVTVSGPPLLIPGKDVDYTIFVDNRGGVAAVANRLLVTLPPELSYVSASITPTAALQWDWETLSARSPLVPLRLTVAVNSQILAFTNLSITAVLTTTTPETNLTNNKALASTPTSMTEAMTLILVAPERMVSHYGTSSIMEKLYELAQHPQVQGVVLDVTADPAVAAAYTNWDADPNSWQRANDVAMVIKSLIDTYDLAYPNLRYLVLIGDDTMLPFYRVADQNGTIWYEQIYSPYVSSGTTVRAALAQDRLLTDDFYATRVSSIPDSPFWLDDHPLYLPDLAIGRLVETPSDIITTINAFLTHNGSITLNPSFVGTDSQLAGDLGQAQCEALTMAGITMTTCTNDNSTFRESVLIQTGGSAWAAFHSSHFSLGTLVASEISDRTQPYDQTLVVTIGCHAGLSVPDDTNLLSVLDLAQAFLSQGGTYIGSTAYTYGSQLSIGYSEALAQILLRHLLVEDGQPIGLALLSAKQTYYTERAGWANFLDEKVLIPVTLYGLPMLQVTKS